MAFVLTGLLSDFFDVWTKWAWVLVGVAEGKDAPLPTSTNLSFSYPLLTLPESPRIFSSGCGTEVLCCKILWSNCGVRAVPAFWLTALWRVCVPSVAMRRPGVTSVTSVASSSMPLSSRWVEGPEGDNLFVRSPGLGPFKIFISAFKTFHQWLFLLHLRNSSFNSLDKYLMNTYYVLSIVLGNGQVEFALS